jgi:hypothetical protein
VGMIQVDFISVTIGYVVGVMLMWSLCNMFYGENYDRKTNDGSEGLYTSLRDGRNDVHICTPERNRR